MQLKVREIIPQTPKAISITFQKPEEFNFYAGQHLDLQDNKGDSRDFTISSSPTEHLLMVTTKKGVTSFKKYLETLSPDDLVNSSHPKGTFTLDENSPAVFIAGGIGITPFRSMIKYAVDSQLKTPIVLIYSNSDENFVFKDELNSWQKQHSNLKIIYINTSKDERLDKTKLATIVNGFVRDYLVYLAGSTSFVDNMEKIVLELGIDEINIRYDRFKGYQAIF